mgnify:CR=1 FL=1
MSKLTGLFFGSFNPIHIGHLIIANTMLQQSEMDEVWFVVSPQNPLKQHNTLLEDNHRLQMVRCAIADNPGFKACDVEFHLPLPSYTVVTLNYLREQYPGREFALIMGGDNLQIFPRWRDYQYILEHYRLFVYPRPGYVGSELENHPHITLVDVPRMDISSTYIREQIAKGNSVRYLLSEPVYKYLSEMHFYEAE